MKRILLLILFILFITGCSGKDVTVNGTVHADANKNAVYDAGEPALQGVEVRSGSKKGIYTDASGNFTLNGEVIEENTQINLFLIKTGFKDTRYPVNIKAAENDNTLAPENKIDIVMQTNK